MNSSSTTNNINPSYYDILNVSPTATQAEIRKAYLKLSLKYHPDKNPDNEEQAKEQFIRVGEAYDTLSDPTIRQTYDRELASGRASFRMSNNSHFSSGNDEQTYESYRQAFDDRMASLSEDDLNALKTVASIIGSAFGTIYGSQLGKKVGGNSNLGRAIGVSAGTLMGSLAGSQAGTNLVSNVHRNSVDRVVYEERRRVARERGESMPEPPSQDRHEDSQGSDLDWKKTGMKLMKVVAAIVVDEKKASSSRCR